MPKDKLTRLSVNMNEKTTKQLRFLMDKADLSATEVVQNAIEVLTYFRNEVVEHGRDIQIVDKRRNQVVELDTWEWK